MTVVKCSRWDCKYNDLNICTKSIISYIERNYGFYDPETKFDCESYEK